MASRCIGGCVPLFMLGVAFDVIGLTVLLVGALANPRLDDRFYGDFLIYTGSIVVFLSLGWWVLWYMGTVQISNDIEKNKLDNLAQWARNISSRFSKDRSKPLEKSISGSMPVRVHIPTKISWQNLGYDNAAYERSTDMSTISEKRVELDNVNSKMLTSSSLNTRTERLL